MKKRVIVAAALLCAVMSYGQGLKPIQLKKPDMARKGTVMEALSKRASVREYSDRKLSEQDLSDLLWAGNGVNRPDKGGRTAASAMNFQDVDIYVLTAEGAYLYNAHKSILEPVAAGDLRAQISPQQAYVAAVPVNLILVSDLAKFTRGDEAGKERMAALDVGIVSQNIAIFCAAAGLATVPRAMIDVEKLGPLLKLRPAQKIFLNHPVGYPK